MANPQLGLELFGLGVQRALFARQAFTTSFVRVAEHIYRALLFDSPAEWGLEVLTSTPWQQRSDEEAAFRSHRGGVTRLFDPPSLPLVNRWITHPWREWLQRHRYAPKVRQRGVFRLAVHQLLAVGRSPARGPGDRAGGRLFP